MKELALTWERCFVIRDRKGFFHSCFTCKLVIFTSYQLFSSFLLGLSHCDHLPTQHNMSWQHKCPTIQCLQKCWQYTNSGKSQTVVSVKFPRSVTWESHVLLIFKDIGLKTCGLEDNGLLLRYLLTVRCERRIGWKQQSLKYSRIIFTNKGSTVWRLKDLMRCSESESQIFCSFHNFWNTQQPYWLQVS